MLDIYNYISQTQMANFSRKYNKEEIIVHEERVAEYALKIIEVVNEDNCFSKPERNLLYFSALIHDIGYFINKEKHQKHSRYLILSDRELDIVPGELRNFLAIIASSHRKSLDKRLELYNLETRNKLLRLVSILRMADSLDHGHKHEIVLNKIVKEKDSLIIHIGGKGFENIYDRFIEKTMLFNDIFRMKTLLMR
ncbi:MAG: HD domain-containing protein [Clostridiaceae bacterium]